MSLGSKVLSLARVGLVGLVVLLFLSVGRGFADDVWFPLYKLNSQGATNRDVLMTPLTLFPAANQLAVYDREKVNSGTNAAFAISNMMQGFYQGSILAPPDRTDFSFFVEANGTGGPMVWVTTILRATPQSVARPQDYAYSATAMNAKLADYALAGAGGLNFLPQPASVNLSNWSGIAPSSMASTQALASAIAAIPTGGLDTNAVMGIIASPGLALNQPSITRAQFHSAQNDTEGWEMFSSEGERKWLFVPNGLIGYDGTNKTLIFSPSGDATLIGTVQASAFFGAGSGLTGLNAGYLASGTVPAARLPGHAGDWAQLDTNVLAGIGSHLGSLDLRVVGIGSASVTLAWDASTGTNVAGYHIWYGGVSGSYTNSVDAGTDLMVSVSGLAPGGTYYFAATAYDGTGDESDFSNEISYTVPTGGGTIPSDLAVNTITATNGIVANGKSTISQDVVGNVFSVKAFGATGSGLVVTNVSMTAGSAVLTASPGYFTVLDIGKICSVYGAGDAMGHNLSAAIVGWSSANAVTLGAAAGTNTSGMSAVYGWDDTAGVQAGLTFVSTNAGHGTLMFPAGIYLINGPIQDPEQDYPFYKQWWISGRTGGTITVSGTTATCSTEVANDLVSGEWIEFAPSSEGQTITPSYYQPPAKFQVTRANSTTFTFQVSNGTPNATGLGSYGILISHIRPVAHKNAQLILPDLPLEGQTCGSIRLQGVSTPCLRDFSSVPSTYFNAPGSVIWSTTNLGSGSIFGCENPTTYNFGGGNDGRRKLNNIRVEIERMTWRAGQNPQGNGIDLRGASGCLIRDVMVDTGYPLYYAPLPTYSNSYAIWLPPVFEPGMSVIQNVVVQGWRNGLGMGEHLVASGYIGLFSCYNAMNFANAGGHANIFELLDIESCANYFYNENSYYLTGGKIFATVTSENQALGGQQAWAKPPGSLVYDPYNAMQGHISYMHSTVGGLTNWGGNGVDVDYYGRISPSGNLLSRTTVSPITHFDNTLQAGTVLASTNLTIGAIENPAPGNDVGRDKINLCATNLTDEQDIQWWGGSQLQWRVGANNSAFYWDSDYPSFVQMMRLDSATGDLSIYGKFVGGGAGLNAGTVPLTSLAQGGASLNQVIKWNGSAWSPADSSGSAIANVFTQVGINSFIAGSPSIDQIGNGGIYALRIVGAGTIPTFAVPRDRWAGFSKIDLIGCFVTHSAGTYNCYSKIQYYKEDGTSSYNDINTMLSGPTSFVSSSTTVPYYVTNTYTLPAICSLFVTEGVHPAFQNSDYMELIGVYVNAHN